MAKLLYLDDQQVNLDVFIDYFEDEVELVTTTNFETALDHVKKDPEISIVLSDYFLDGGRTGDEYLRLVYDLRPSVRKILVSAQTHDNQTKQLINENHIDRMIIKPINEDLIMEEIKNFAQ